MEENFAPAMLDLFDGEGGAEGAAGTQASPDSSRPGETGGKGQQVVYGKQGDAPAAGEKTAGEGSDAGSGKEKPKSREQLRREYLALVEGEYKEVAAERTQRAIDQRFKETKSLREALEAQRPLVEMLGSRYGVTDGDVNKLVAALEADKSYWEAAADQAGMSVEQYVKMQRIERENQRYRAQQEEWQAQAAAREQMSRWAIQEREMQETYPDFDLEREMQNPGFKRLLMADVPMRHAYEVSHLEDIKGGVAASSAQEAERKVTDNIRARGARPAENGTTAGQAGVVVKADVSKLTPEDRREIARRARLGGEPITF